MTICNKYFRREKGNAIFPDIRLCGKWLMESGFKGGHVIDIRCEDRKLVITLAEEQRFEHLMLPENDRQDFQTTTGLNRTAESLGKVALHYDSRKTDTGRGAHQPKIR